MSSSPRVVLDTNVLLRGIASGRSPSGVLLRWAEARRLVVLTSKQLIAEYRDVLLDPAIVERIPSLTPEIVEVTLRRLRYVGDYFPDVRVRFKYPRDPKDEKLIELAIRGEATHLITLDDDLLSLQASRSDAGKRFRQRLPQIQVMEPHHFVDRADPLE